MPGARCVVSTCNNSLYKTRNQPGEHILYHTFPKDLEIRKKWVQRCRRPGKWKPTSSHICSIHFTNDDYVRDLQAELLNIPKRKLLKKNALPTQFLPPNVIIEEPSTTNLRYIRLMKRKQKEEVDNILKSSVNQNITMTNTSKSNTQTIENLQIGGENVHAVKSDLGMQENATSSKRQESIVHPALSYSLQYYEKTKKEYQAILKRNRDLECRNKCLHIELSRVLQKNEDTKQKLSKLEDALKQKQILILNSAKIKDILEQNFTKNQVNLILKRKQRVSWTTDEISQAFTIRHFSKRCYIYLREKLKYPLPGISTLQKWASKIVMNQGILPDVLRFMDIASVNFTDSDRVVVLHFDKMKVKTCTEYDQLNNVTIGPHDQMLIVQARSLFSNWKQIIYVDFDQTMTSNILYNIIEHLEKINYKVVACVSNCEENNIDLWKKMDITFDESWFLNPKTGEKIFVFIDAPSLLKLLHKQIIETGFFLNDKHINVKNLLKLINEDINFCKLTDEHLVKGKKEKNVKLAKELFSPETAMVLRKYYPDIENITADFFELVSNWYDIFNSSTINNEIPLNSGFGIYLDDQTKLLNQFSDEITSMHCGNTRCLKIFQECILISINSLILLQEYLMDKYSKEYILTHKLNQDMLKNLFSQLKRTGINDFPSPITALSKLRMIILGKTSELNKKNNNDTEVIREEYIVSSVLSKTGISVNLPKPDLNKESIQSSVEEKNEIDDDTEVIDNLEEMTDALLEEESN